MTFGKQDLVNISDSYENDFCYIIEIFSATLVKLQICVQISQCIFIYLTLTLLMDDTKFKNVTIG